MTYDTVITSLKIAALVAAAFALFMAILTMRLHTAWRRMRRGVVSIPCQDPQQVRFQLSEALKPMGYQPAPASGIGFTMEPPSWRRSFGAAAVAVDFPEPRLAVITGQAAYLSRFARSRGVPVNPAPGTQTFSEWFKEKLKMSAWLTAVVFVVAFLFFALVAHPGKHRSNGLAPGESENFSPVR